jgi:NADPH:quinone reductase-like Zn-dependent oxidoreductase
MQAYRVEEPDGSFCKVELPRPVPEENHVLVKIHASGINPLDIKIRAGEAGHAKQPLSAVLGLDTLGKVVIEH